MADDLALTVGGRKLAGWSSQAVTLRAEAFPNSFTVELTARDPANGSSTIVNDGDPCQVHIGSDLLVTGYVDRVSEGSDGEGHRLSITGRGKTQDLVDCMAEWPSDQLIGGTALDIATKLAAPYGIEVMLANGADGGPQVPFWAINYGETGAAIVQRVAQNAGLLAYEDAKGRLLLAAVGSRTAASGIIYGQNCEIWDVEAAMDQRFSEVVCCAQSMAAWSDLPGSDFFDTERDPNVPRHRRMALILAQVAEDPQAFTIKKAKWEIARRAGRALTVTATIDSWRDSAGTLWAPNTLIPVSLPSARIREPLLCISEVTFRYGEDGTHADFLLMPRAAFTPEPINLQPLNAADVIGPDTAQ